MHRLRRLRPRLPDPCLDAEQDPVFPHDSPGPQRQEEPPHGHRLQWLDADSVVKIISNVYAYAQKYIDPEVPGGKEHIGYIVDRTGTEEFLRWIMKDVNLPPKAEIYKPLYWDGIRYSGLK